MLAVGSSYGGTQGGGGVAAAAENSGANVTNGQVRPTNFARGEKSSVSVRLRKKKESEALGAKKRNRHSGDFSFFSSKLEAVGQRHSKMVETTEKEDEDDWAYITFPNGVPSVQEIKTNVGSNGQPVQTTTTPASAVVAQSNGEPVRTPVKVVTREVPGLFPIRQGGINNGNKVNKRQSADFSGRIVPGIPASAGVYEQVHMRQQQRPVSQAIRSSRIIEERMPPSDPMVSPVKLRHQNRRRSEQGAVAKRCSGEFEMKKNNRRSGGDFGFYAQAVSPALSDPKPGLCSPVGSVESGIGSNGSSSRSMSGDDVTKAHDVTKAVEQPRRIGLGRRSVTQINIQHKKNSYNSALCKSQENLVKASVMSDDRSLDKESSTLKKGLLWQQRDKLFSRWKERYFILTSDYLNCFKKGTSRITEMGGFIFKIKLNEIEDVELLDKRGYLTICISLQKEGKVYLRKTEGIRDWFNALKDCVRESKKRRTEKNSGGFWNKKQVTDSSSIEQFLNARKKIGLQYAYSDSTPEINKLSSSKPSRVEITLDELSDLYRQEEEERNQGRPKPTTPPANNNNVINIRVRDDNKPNVRNRNKINRLSLMSDIELPDFGGQDLGCGFEKGIFLRKKGILTAGVAADTDSNDSGNNSMNTNGSVGSSKSSNSTPRDEPLETHLESEEDNADITQPKPTVRLRDRSRGERSKQQPDHRRSHMTGLQITHV